MKKYYKLEYLESFVGKEFLHKQGQFHLKVQGLQPLKWSKPHTEYDTQLRTLVLYSNITFPNTKDSNGSIDVSILEKHYILKTETVRLFYEKE